MELDTTKLMPTKDVRATLGGISEMTLWRWQHDDAMGFPVPVRFRTRKYWKAADILAFVERNQVAA
ncbi:helix-turn-helix transcriptional regulator [Phaeovulum sp.]|uniref:helix-turn-helix transcriptional regulator n=1 Tax=Phaeovulum sp. TaxID=2934796 RepID=UPI0039E34080